MFKIFKKITLRIAILSAWIFLTTVYCHAQASNFIGFGYSYMNLRPTYQSLWLTDAVRYKEHYSAYEMNFFRISAKRNISFNGSIDYIPFQYTSYSYPDPRYPYNYTIPVVWMGTDVNYKSQNMSISMRLMFSSGDKIINGFFALGPAYKAVIHSSAEVFETNRYQHLDSITHFSVIDSTVTRRTKTNSGFASNGVGFEIQMGIISKVYSNFYFSVIARADLVGLNGSHFLALEFGLYYKLTPQSAKTESSP